MSLKINQSGSADQPERRSVQQGAMTGRIVVVLKAGDSKQDGVIYHLASDTLDTPLQRRSSEEMRATPLPDLPPAAAAKSDLLWKKNFFSPQGQFLTQETINAQSKGAKGVPFFRGLPIQLQRALNSYTTKPKELKNKEIKDIRLEDLKAPVMVGKDAKTKAPFMTVCYQTSEGKVGFDVLYFNMQGFYVNINQFNSELRAFTSSARREYQEHLDTWGTEKEPYTIDEFDSGKGLEARLKALFLGRETPQLVENMDDLKQVRLQEVDLLIFQSLKHADQSPGAPTVHLFDPKKGQRYQP